MTTAPTYMDFAATAPVGARVAEVVLRYMTEEFGNAGSRTHEWGARAKRDVGTAREAIAATLDAHPTELTFTSGATESNNLALLGMARHGAETGRRHIVSCVTEHKAVLEPLEVLSGQGFEVDLLSPGPSGRLHVDQVLERIRPDTLLVSLMHVNNETGVMHPIRQIADALQDTDVLFHVDGAQGFGKLTPDLRAPIDLISISGHKIGAPKGIGALLARRRGSRRPPLAPLMFGGGQERRLRPGTLPVALVMGLAEAATIFEETRAQWTADSLATRAQLLRVVEPLGAVVNGDPRWTAPHILNIAFPGVDGEALLLAMKNVVSVSTGSACTSASYTPSHVLTGMGLDGDRVEGSVRFSWSGASELDLAGIAQAVSTLVVN